MSSDAPPSHTPHALLFDLGAVLLKIDMSAAFTQWSRFSPYAVEEIGALFKALPLLEDHERGIVEDATFFETLRTELQLHASLGQIAEGWNAIFAGEFEATRRLVQAVRDTVPCYALTNSTASHLATWPALFPELASAFERVFASYALGARKPDAEVFARVCAAMGCAPAEVLFFDDSPVNVEAAAAMGLRGVLVRSTADVETALRDAGLLDQLARESDLGGRWHCIVVLRPSVIRIPPPQHAKCFEGDPR